MSEEHDTIFEFEGFSLDVKEGVLSRDNVPISLTPKAFATLVHLLRNSGRLVEKSQLIEQVWEGTFVEESAVSWCVWSIRSALGDDSKTQKFIQTVPRRGYRFVAPVSETNYQRHNGNGSQKHLGLPPKSDHNLAHNHLIRKESAHESTNKSSRADLTVASVGEKTIDLLTQASTVEASRVRLYDKYIAVGIAAVLVLSFTAIYYLTRTASSSEIDPLPVPANPTSRSLNGTSEVMASRLSLSDNIVNAKISSDGKKVVYSKGIGNEHASIWIRDLEARSNLEILTVDDVDYGGLDIGTDGRFIYFSRRPHSIPASPFDIYRVPTVGGVPEKIVGGTQGWIDVSEDGNVISFVRCDRRDDEYCSLWIADATTGDDERKLVFSPKPINISTHAISPDGTRIAYAVGQSHTGSNDFSVAVVDIGSGREEIFVDKSFFNIRSLVWSSDSTSIFAAAAKAPNMKYDLWKITFDNKIQLTRDAESYNQISVSQDGTKFLATTIREDFALKVGTTNSPDVSRTITAATHAVFSSNQRFVFSSQNSGNHEIWIIDQDSSNLRQLTNDDGEDRHPIISDDQRSIFFTSNRSGVLEIWRMNIDGSEQVKITNENGGFPLRVTQDNKWLYYQHAIHRSLYRVPVNGGDAEPVLDTPAADFAVAPDATKAAYYAADTSLLTVFSFGEQKGIRSFRFGNGTAKIVDIVWDVNNNSLHVVANEPKRKTHSLWEIKLDGSDPKFLRDLGPESISDFHLSPDAKKVLYTQGGWRNDILLLEGLG